MYTVDGTNFFYLFIVVFLVFLIGKPGHTYVRGIWSVLAHAGTVGLLGDWSFLEIKNYFIFSVFSSRILGIDGALRIHKCCFPFKEYGCKDQKIKIKVYLN